MNLKLMNDKPKDGMPAHGENAPKLFTVGTLSYTKQGLYILFFWLMWNDFTIMMMEAVAGVNNLTLVKMGASYTFIALLGSIAAFMGLWINPTFSTWSDRTRTRFGRRRPFLMIAAPMFAITLIAVPYAPDLYHALMNYGPTATLLKRFPAFNIPGRGEIFFFGGGCIANALCNAVVLSLFSYYYWDVVPGSVLGRFQAMARVVTSMSLLVWNFYIFGLAEHHLKEVYLGVSMFCLAIYLLSVWNVKEGEYPPPEPRARKGFIEPIRAYFTDCFSKPYYLWIFVGSMVSQVGNLGNNYMTYYLITDLKLSYKDVGWVTGMGQSFSMTFGILLGFAVGSLVDRLQPLRVLPIIILVRAALLAVGFFVVRDKMTAMIIYTLNEGLLVFLLSVAIGAATVQMFPLEKLGQFCSAQSFFCQTLFLVINPLVGHFFDWIHFNRFSYAWGSIFQTLAGLIYIKVYLNWKRQHQPVPKVMLA